MRSSNASQMGPQPMRTPAAWYHRDVHLSRPNSRQPPPVQYGQQAAVVNPRTSSPSLTTTSSDDREEVPIVRHPMKRQSIQSQSQQTVDRRSVISRISRAAANGQQIYGQSAMINGDANLTYASSPSHPPATSTVTMYRTGTLRSSRSVPGFVMTTMTTWDGEPCPVHGTNSPSRALSMSPVSLPPPMTVKRYNSVADLRGTNNSFFPMMTIVPPSINGDVGGNKFPIAQMAANPQRPLFVPAFSEHHLPLRDHYKVSPAPIQPMLSSKLKQQEAYGGEDVCCRGHLIVLWIILGVVTIGVISGIILGVTVN
ncbi:hypothetical protein B4U79_03900 [Dinothrombium tinctorium]|uniref:Uncharacterized protein n=1 Tax=Dinothrombium tinctorium TaxID=1965070 RepID=A0A3S3SBU9_9ACAR|nr:hypothetical protein B4U79_01377 [Dinothrombium tinctorium]RWS13237.1 hypothetical protein B4U79_03900 [Dinothrombium tinctorium]